LDRLHAPDRRHAPHGQAERQQQHRHPLEQHQHHPLEQHHHPLEQQQQHHHPLEQQQQQHHPLEQQRARSWALFDHPLMRDGFGFGPRMCLGGRLAEMEIYTAVCEILLHNRIVHSDDRDVSDSSSSSSSSNSSCSSNTFSSHTVPIGRRRYEIVNHAATYPDPAPELLFVARHL
jgi:hypothetical protein